MSESPSTIGRVLVAGSNVLALEQIVLKMLEVRPRRADDGVRARRRDDAARAADEQRIVERLAQPAQRLADRGLAHPELSRGAADAQLVVQRDRDGQQIEIQSLRYHTASVVELLRCTWRRTRRSRPGVGG